MTMEMTMKKLNLWRGITISAILLTSVLAFAEIRTMYITRINNGEVFNDTKGAVISFSEEHAVKPGGLSLKLQWTKPGWAGDWQPKRSNWSGMNRVAFSIFSTAGKDKKMTFVVKDSAVDEPGAPKNANWGVIPFTLKPGMNEVELKVSGLRTKDGKRALDLSHIRQWHFSYCLFPEEDWEEKWDGEFTIYINDVKILGGE